MRFRLSVCNVIPTLGSTKSLDYGLDGTSGEDESSKDSAPTYEPLEVRTWRTREAAFPHNFYSFDALTPRGSLVVASGLCTLLCSHLQAPEIEALRKMCGLQALKEWLVDVKNPDLDAPPLHSE